MLYECPLKQPCPKKTLSVYPMHPQVHYSWSTCSFCTHDIHISGLTLDGSMEDDPSASKETVAKAQSVTVHDTSVAQDEMLNDHQGLPETEQYAPILGDACSATPVAARAGLGTP